MPLYGATLAGEIRHVKVDACKPFPRDAVEALKRDSASSPVIALVDRGDCFFIEKAFNAEKAGAAALIVADDRDEALVTMVRFFFSLCFYFEREREGRERVEEEEKKKERLTFPSSLWTTTTTTTKKKQAAPDDRPDISKLKEEITIPTALVTQSTGKRLKEALDRASAPGGGSKRSEKVLAELDWTDAVAHPDARVEWELWSTPDDGCGPSCDRQRAFKRAFERQAVELEKGGFAQFTPRFVSRRCSFGASAEDAPASTAAATARWRPSATTSRASTAAGTSRPRPRGSYARSRRRPRPTSPGAGGVFP